LCLVGVSRAALPSPDVVVNHARAAQAPPREVDVTYMERTAGVPSRRAFRVRARGYGVFRLDTQDLAIGATHTRVWVRPGLKGPGHAGPEVGLPEARSALDDAPFWIRWFLGEPVETILQDMEVDMSRVSLDHDGAVILWVLGASPAEDDLPQVHVERRGGILRRLVERRRIGTERMGRVFTFDAQGEESANHVWPSGFTIRTGEEERRFEIRRWVEQPALSDAIFVEPEAQPTGKELR